MSGSLDGRVALVTGSSKNIGKGMALEVAAAGATTYLTARTLADGTDPLGSLERTAAEIADAGGTAIPVACDHTDAAQVEALFDRIADEQGRLDVVVNVASPTFTDMVGVPFWERPVDEIVIDRRDRVIVGKDGTLRGSGKAFSSDDTFERVVKRLVAEAGGSIDDAHPLVDLRMRDGTRLTAAVSPVASRGACLVLKKVPTSMPQLQDLVAQSSLSSGNFIPSRITPTMVAGVPLTRSTRPITFGSRP